MQTQDTIAAIATPPGRGGISVVRLSGPDARRIAETRVRLKHAPVSHTARYGQVLDRDGAPLDDALLTWFAAPASYTGEDVVEIGTHGAPVIVQTLLQLLLESGARLAGPGEFTERAYLSGRLDLSAAEAVRDLIDSSTVAQARLAAQQLGGSLQREVRPAKDALVRLIATLEAGIDFAEDDLETAPTEQIAADLAALLPPLEQLLRSFAHGRLVREGLRLAIVGKPNAGKSSLFNRLLDQDRAIVTPVPGTTRDVLRETAVIGGIPVGLLDTAGLRETDDPVERIGVARSHEAMADADLLLHVIDATDVPQHTPTGTADELTSAASRLTIWNKADLLTPEQRQTLPANALLTSATTGEGIDALRAAILEHTGAAHAASSATLTNTRQRDCIARSLNALQQAADANRTGTPHEMLLLDLYGALDALNDLTGQTTTDDILNQIFSTFCIGK